jgi:chromosomal replication initiation ATPase DnaA
MILERASRVTGYSVADITGPRRDRPLAYTRFAIMDCLRAQGLSLPQIGRVVHRHHTTVLDGLRQAQKLRGQTGFEIIRSAIA